MSADPWRVAVTDDDVAAAREAWTDARDRGAPRERVDLLWADLERLWRAQAKQLVEEIQRRARARAARPSGPRCDGRSDPTSGYDESAPAHHP